MAANRNDQILRFLVEAQGTDALKPFLESVRQLEGASDETRAAAQGLLDEIEQASGLQKTVAEFEKLSASVGTLAAKFETAKAKSDGLAADLAKIEQPTKRQTEALDRARSSTERFGAALDAEKAKLSGLVTILSSAGLSTTNFATATGQIKDKATQATQGLAALGTAAAKTRTEADALAARLADGDEAFRRQVESSRSAREALDRLRAGTKATADAQQDAAAKSTVLGAAWTRLAAIGATLAGYLSFRAAADGIKQILGMGDATERLEKRLAGLYGTQEAGKKAFDAIRQLARDTGQEFAATAESAAKLKGFGIEPLNGSLKALIDQNAKLGGSQETLNGLILATGQAWAKQKLQGEEILQLVERGVPVWDLLSKATGKNVLELQKLSEAGKLGRAEISALLAEIGKSADGAAAANLGTFSGLIVQLKDQWQQFLQAIADAGVLDYAKEQIGGLLDAARRLAQDGTLTQWAKSTADGIKTVSNVVIGAAKVAYEYSGAIVSLGKAYATIKLTQLTAEIGLLILKKYAAVTATTALTGATVAASTAMGGLGAAIGRIPTAVKVGIALVGAELAISSLGNLVDAVEAYREASARLNLEREELGKSEEKLAKKVDELKNKFSAYADVAIRSSTELAALSAMQAEAYQKQLEGAQRYFRALEIEAKSAGDKLGFDAARQKLVELQAELDRVKGRVSAMAAEFTVVQPQINAFAAKMVEAFQTAYKEGKNAAESIREEFGKIDVATVKGLTDAIETIREIGKVSAEAGAALQAELREKLQAMSDEDLKHVREMAEAAFGAGSEQAKAFGNAVEGINLARLGVDLKAIQSGFSKAGGAAVDAFKGAIEEVDKLGLTAAQQSTAIAQAFDGAFSKAGTRPELEALREQLNKAFSEGKISAADYQAAMERLAAAIAKVEPSSKGAAGAIRDVGTAAASSTAATDKLAEGIEKTGETAEEGRGLIESFTVSLNEMSGEFLASALNAATATGNYNDFIKANNAANEQFQQELKRLKGRKEAAREVIDAYDDEAQAVNQLKKEFESINESELRNLAAMEQKARQIRDAAAATKDLTNAEKERKEQQKANGDDQKSETVRSIRVEVIVRADATVGGQTLSQATLDQVVTAITPKITRAVLDEIERDQRAAGF